MIITRIEAMPASDGSTLYRPSVFWHSDANPENTAFVASYVPTKGQHEGWKRRAYAEKHLDYLQTIWAGHEARIARENFVFAGLRARRRGMSRGLELEYQAVVMSLGRRNAHYRTPWLRTLEIAQEMAVEWAQSFNARLLKTVGGVQ